MAAKPGIDGGKAANTATTPLGATAARLPAKPKSLLRVTSNQTAQSPIAVDSTLGA